MVWYSQMARSILESLERIGVRTGRAFSSFGLKMSLILLCLVLLSPSALAFSPFQLKKAQEAYNLAAPYGLGLTFTALVYKESSFCKHKIGIDPYGNGCTQIHRSTAQKYFSFYITRKRLHDDDAFNMEAGLDELRNCQDLFKDFASSLICYKSGPGAVEDIPFESREFYPYVVQIRRLMEEVRGLGIEVVPLPSK